MTFVKYDFKKCVQNILTNEKENYLYALNRKFANCLRISATPVSDPPIPLTTSPRFPIEFH